MYYKTEDLKTVHLKSEDSTSADDIYIAVMVLELLTPYLLSNCTVLGAVLTIDDV